MQEKKGIDRAVLGLKKLNYWILFIPIIAMFGMMFLDGVNVITIRFFGFRAVPGHKELIEELMIIVVYVGLAYVLLERGHIKTNILKNQFPPALRFAADIIADLVCIGLPAFMAYVSGTGLVWSIIHRSAKQGDVQFPLTPFYVVVTASFAMLSIAAVFIMIKHIAHRGEEEGPKGKVEEVLSQL